MRPGDNIDGRFDLEVAVATGGMGQVYRGRDRQTGSPVAVKLLTHTDALAEERFLQESLVLAEIHHPGVVRYVAHGHIPTGEPYLVMEWLEGEDLAAYLRRSRDRSLSSPGPDTGEVAYQDDQTPHSDPGLNDQQTMAMDAPPGELEPDTQDTIDTGDPAPGAPAWARTGLPRLGEDALGPQLSLAEVALLGRRLASAVAELHRRGIVHRDIKPANLFLCGGSLEHIKLLDLGTAHRRTLGQRLTEPGRLVGTPHYMAPEQARAGDTLTPATDVWAIGCVLYECLSGLKPFSGDDLLVVLARILMDEPQPIQYLRRDVPDDLADLLMATLAKNPADRPSDAAMLAGAFESLGSVSRILQSARARTSGDREVPLQRALTTAERRVTSMLFADAASMETLDDMALARVIRPLGAQLQRLADGTLLITIAGAETPTDQAVRAARTALLLHERFPALRMVLATGHTEGQAPLGQAVAEAAKALRNTADGAIWVDALTAALLDARFVIVRDGDDAYLRQERSTEATRTLLGKPTRWVGRQRELATLAATFAECVEDEVARVVLVTASAGMGKSRLRYEFEREVSRKGSPYQVVRGQGDAVSAGSPFIMIAPGVRRLAGILDGEPSEVRQGKLLARLQETVPESDLARIAGFLGEMIGVPFPDDDNDSLRAARKDPMFLGQLMQKAWEDWLRAECERQPVVVLLEDLHWGDLPSVKYIDGALGALAHRPLMVLALARPEVHTVFPRLWHQRDVQEMPLNALSPKSSAMLVRDVLGSDVSDKVVDAVVQRAGGNAFYLEELIRTVAESGSSELPDTILGMVQARLDALGPEAKRILRAGSIFGEVFWRGGVEALSGGSGVFDIREWLDDLVAREIISLQPDARVPGETEYKFRHALVRDGAYAMLTEEDRGLGHALAGQWLEQAGEQDGLILAEHFIRGGDTERSIPYLRRAAEQALEGNDLASVMRRAERAIQAGASGEMLGALRALQSVASYWLSDYSEGQRHGCAAAELLPTGSAQWFVAVGNAIVASARLGDYERVDELFARAASATCEPLAEAEQLICLCRGTFQLIFNARFVQADQILARIAALAASAPHLDALTSAQVNHVQGVRAAHVGDVSTFLYHLQAAVHAFELAGDTRNVSLERTTVAWCWAELGYFEYAAELCEKNLVHCQQQNAQQAITYAKVNLGYILANCQGRLDDARSVLHEAIAECREVGNPRLEGWARAHLTDVEHQADHHDVEEREARRAAELLHVSPGLQAWALTTHARALLALGRVEEARQPAERAMATLDRLGGLLQGESLPPLILAQLLHATGDLAGARRAIADAMARLERRAARLSSPEWREAFLAIPDNRKTRELAARWLTEDAL